MIVAVIIEEHDVMWAVACRSRAEAEGAMEAYLAGLDGMDEHDLSTSPDLWNYRAWWEEGEGNYTFFIEPTLTGIQDLLVEAITNIEDGETEAAMDCIQIALGAL